MPKIRIYRNGVPSHVQVFVDPKTQVAADILDDKGERVSSAALDAGAIPPQYEVAEEIDLAAPAKKAPAKKAPAKKAPAKKSVSK